MGTRSLTFIYENGRPFVNMYRQFDGYPSGHGMHLHDFLASGKLVNGYSDRKAKQFNGMECLAAQMIAHFKKGVGGFYMHHPNESDLGQDYEYHVKETQDGLHVTVISYGESLFSGMLPEFKAFCEREE